MQIGRTGSSIVECSSICIVPITGQLSIAGLPYIRPNAGEFGVKRFYLWVILGLFSHDRFGLEFVVVGRDWLFEGQQDVEGTALTWLAF
jgi:hypothetical protein